MVDCGQTSDPDSSRRLSVRLIDASLSADEIMVLDEVNAFFPAERYPQGSLICECGQVPSSIRILLCGKALLTGAPGVSTVVSLKSKVEQRIYGLSEMFTGMPFDYSLQPITECLVKRMNQTELEMFLDKNDSSRIGVIKELCRELDLLYRSIREH